MTTQSIWSPILVTIPLALNGLSNVTTEFWLKTARTGKQSVFSGANAGNNNEYLIFLDSDTSLEFYTGATSESYVSWDIPTVADSQWHHFAIVRNDTADSVEFYLDGVSQGTRSTPLTTLSVDTDGLVLGQDQDTVGGGFAPAQALQGQLEQVCIWNTARDAAGIQDDLTNPPQGSESGLVSCWLLDDGTGTTALDQTGSHAATLGGGDAASAPAWVVSTAPVTGVVSTGVAETANAIDGFALNCTRPLTVSSAITAENYELREAGADGQFYDAVNHPDDQDDSVFTLSPTYTSGAKLVALSANPEPLQPGSYQFRTLSGLIDQDGNAVPPFTLQFTVRNPAAGRIESTSNDVRASATPLPMTEFPAGSGFFTALGVGSLSTDEDQDYWQFDAEAGDRVTVCVETTDLGTWPDICLENGTGTALRDGYGDDDGSALLQDFTIPAPGTYYVRIAAWRSTRYEMRVDQSRGPRLEVETNDYQEVANYLPLAVTAGVCRGTMAGTILASDPGDYYSLGQLNAGNAISLTVSSPPFSTLAPSDTTLTIEEAGTGTILASSDTGELPRTGAE